MIADTESAEKLLWGNTFLPAVLGAIGCPAKSVQSVRLHFEYGYYATATIRRDDGGDEIVKQLPIFGTHPVSEALGAPKGLQAITVEIGKDNFTICHCRYLPIKSSFEDVIKALSTIEEVAL